jgi:hypothetical protein
MLRKFSALMVFAVAVAGCGGGSNNPTTGTDASSAHPDAAAAFRYSACMRRHGVPNFPDPIVRSSPGHASVGLKVNPAETNSPSFESAQKACNSIMPAPSPSQIAAQQRHELQGKLSFARCMRRRGITGFPDPTTQGQITPAMLSSAGVDIHASGVIDAAEACAASSDGTISKADIRRATGGGP